MSIEWMTHVWNNSKQKGSRLLMLLAIADYANEEGSAYPGLESLARKTRQTKRNAIRIIEKIVEDEELEIDTKASKLGTNLYQIQVSTRKPKKSLVTIRAGSGDILGKQGGDIPVPQLSPDPSLPINRNPSVEPGASPPPAVTAYREVARRFPDKELWSDIAGAVGESETDLVLWREVVHGYVASGWNKLNIKAMLDYFKRREVPNINGKIGHRAQSEHPAIAGMRMALEEMGQNGND